jgi:hypothetical protein
MGMFAETAIVDYHFSFADQGKQTSVFHFRLQQTNLKFAISVFFLQKPNRCCRFPLAPVSICEIPETLRCEKHGYGDIKRKAKNESQAISPYLFTVCESELALLA